MGSSSNRICQCIHRLGIGSDKNVAGDCPVFEPFRCPQEGLCISIQVIRLHVYTHYPFLRLSISVMELQIAWMLMMKTHDFARQVKPCNLFTTAHIFCKARRPPVEETTNFLKSLLLSHGPDFLEQLFGERARNYLQVIFAQVVEKGNIIFKHMYVLKLHQNPPNAGPWRCRQGSHTPLRMPDN